MSAAGVFGHEARAGGTGAAHPREPSTVHPGRGAGVDAGSKGDRGRRDGSGDDRAKQSQAEKDTRQMITLTCGSYDTTQRNLPRKQKADSQTHRTDLWLLRGKGCRRDRAGGWDQQMQTITYIGWRDDEALL